ncbi:kinase-like protein [Annulohypoxylon bovei var. microspora]|nr:kinase-like protein [Annulohypoxylon bovei var. microspora]
MFQNSGDTHFTSQGLLGQGGFGAVDLVVSRLSFARYARKRVLRGRDSDSNRREQASILEELKQLKRLSHRHLVKIIGSYTDKEYIAYLMSPVAHGTLDQFLTRTGILHSGQLEMLRRFYGCLAGAVHHLHKNRIRHRDLTARNILIYDSGVYLSDFGSAYNWAHRPTSNTRHMNIPVSPDYMAPEVARKEQVGSSSDLWSLGIVFLEMTTRLLGRQIDELRGRISSHARKTKAAPYIYANYPVVSSWLEDLRLGNMEINQGMARRSDRLCRDLRPSTKPAPGYYRGA